MAYLFVIETNNGTTYKYTGTDESVERHLKLNQEMGAKVIFKEEIS